MTAFGAIRALAKAGFAFRINVRWSALTTFRGRRFLHSLADHGAPADGEYGTAAATIVLEAIDAHTQIHAMLRSKSTRRATHRRIVPELIVLESTRQLEVVALTHRVFSDSARHLTQY